jgi:hypothetical protein
MKQIKVRWGDLGSPTQIGTYACGPIMVVVTPGDIKLAKDNPDTVFTAIHPDSTKLPIFSPVWNCLITEAKSRLRTVVIPLVTKIRSKQRSLAHDTSRHR